MFKKLSTAAGLLLISISMTAACGGNNDPAADSCEESQVDVGADVPDGNGGVAIAKGCYETCDPNGNGDDCASGETCTKTSLGGLCVGGSTANNTDPNNMNTNNTSANNTSANNTTANNTTANNTTPNNTTPNNTTPNNTTPNNDNPNNTNPGFDKAGEACAADADCAGGQCLTADDGFPGGYCVLQNCGTDADCGAGGTCFAFESGNVCVASCGAGLDCREGYSCETDEATDTSICLPAVVPPENVGAACAGSADCDASGDGGERCIGGPDQAAGDIPVDGFPGGYCSGECVEDRDCGDGSLCTLGLIQFSDANGNPIPNAGVCVKACADDSECRDDYVCRSAAAGEEKSCVPPIIPPESVGANCVDNTTCDTSMDGGDLCLNDDLFQGGMSPFPNGYCSGFCSLSAAQDECPTGSHCAAVFDTGNPDQGLCFQDCSVDSECAADNFCEDPNNDGVLECWGEEIELANGTGVPGDACMSTGDCSGGAAGSCITEDTDMNGDTIFPGGYCILDCTNNPGSCPAGSTCIGVNENVSVCLDNCSAADPCRTDYECFDPSTGTVGTDGVCFEIDDMMP